MQEAATAETCPSESAACLHVADEMIHNPTPKTSAAQVVGRNARDMEWGAWVPLVAGEVHRLGLPGVTVVVVNLSGIQFLQVVQIIVLAVILWRVW